MYGGGEGKHQTSSGKRAHRGHIGMFNVNGRLKLIYEEVQPLKMEMRPGGGTIISFAFSKPREERDV